MHDVVDAQWLNGYRVRLTFDTGERRDVDISTLTPFDGVFERLKDEAFFRQLCVDPDVGTIVWPNGADLCPDVLYDRSKPAAHS